MQAEIDKADGHTFDLFEIESCPTPQKCPTPPFHSQKKKPGQVKADHRLEVEAVGA